jgi:N-acetylglutamate synthase-like GNAT family acetyltransferase
MNNASLRRATAFDAQNVRTLVRAAYAKWVPLIHREPLPMNADYEQAVTDHIIDLWEENGQLLGLIQMMPAEDHLLIENVAVRPDQQGKGLGETLLHHAEGIARSLASKKSSFTQILFFLLILHFTLGSDTKNIIAGR